jgi:uncharacterized protein (DUF488 family)
MPAPRRIVTVGHSTHPIERFIDLLAGARVEAVADVRRFPGSRRHPQFAAAALAAALDATGVTYQWLGDELGGRRRSVPDSPNDAWRVAGFRAYADHMRSEEFERGLGRLELLGRERRAAFMCAEADWRRCHRRLIADALTARSWSVMHLSPDGHLAPHELPPFATVAGGRVSYASQPRLRDLGS